MTLSLLALSDACQPVSDETQDDWVAFEADASEWMRPASGACDLPMSAPAATCWIVPSTGEGHCTADAPVTFVADSNRLDIDMADHTVLAIDTLYGDAQREYLWTLGNSPTNNGWGGDGGTTANDSEAQLYGKGISVWASDYGHKERLVAQRATATDQLTASVVTVCDGVFRYDAPDVHVALDHDDVFQLDGDEPDLERGHNDTVLHLGLNRVVTGDRHGSGTAQVRIRIR